MKDAYLQSSSFIFFYNTIIMAFIIKSKLNIDF